MCNKQPHKWHKEIKAWAEGATIEGRFTNGYDSWNILSNPSWSTTGKVEYRIKPQLKPDLVRYGRFDFRYISETDCVVGSPYVTNLWNIEKPYGSIHLPNFKVAFADDGTGEYKLKSMEVL